LKEQALAALDATPKTGVPIIFGNRVFDFEQVDTIRRALEALPND
jgi:hypothetical protein